MKKSDVILQARKVFLDPNPPRLDVLIRAKDSKEKVPAGTINDVKQFKEQIAEIGTNS